MEWNEGEKEFFFSQKGFEPSSLRNLQVVTLLLPLGIRGISRRLINNNEDRPACFSRVKTISILKLYD